MYQIAQTHLRGCGLTEASSRFSLQFPGRFEAKTDSKKFPFLFTGDLTRFFEKFLVHIHASTQPCIRTSTYSRTQASKCLQFEICSRSL